MGRRKPVPKKVKRKSGYKGTYKYQKFRWRKLLKQARELAERYGREKRRTGKKS